MRWLTIWMWVLVSGIAGSSVAGCGGKGQGREAKKEAIAAAPVPSPPGYDLGAPVKYVLGETLREISGITFLRGNPDTLYAIEDETGRVYSIHLGGGLRSWHWGGHGDYEDVTVLGDREFVVLRSDGSLFVFPVGAFSKKMVRVYEHILPAGEYEGLFGDEAGKLIAMCKNCAIDDQSKEVTAYVIGYDDKHVLGVRDHFKIVVPGERLTSIHTHVKFHPSCLARHPLTGEWYVVSSVNKVLIVFDDQWRVKEMYALNPTLFKQPEGLAFDRDGNMYISNEGGEGRGNVLLFHYKK